MSAEPFITAYPPDWEETRNWMVECTKLTGRRWPAESIRIDLRYWQDKCLRPGAKGSTFPSCRTMAADWGVGKSTASRLLADVAWWTDERKREAWDRWYLAEVWCLPMHGPVYDPSLAGRRTAPGHSVDTGGPPAGRGPDARSSDGADRERGDGHPPDADGTPDGLDRDTGGDTGDSSTIHNPQSTITEDSNNDPQAARADTRPPLVLLAAVPEADEPEAEPVPPWAGKVAASAKAGGRKVKPAEVAAAFVEALSALRGAAVNPARCATDATPLAALWKAEGFPPLAEFVAEAVLVGKAARESKNPLFARDIRAEGWAEGVDRSRSVATLTVQARWQDRVRAARAEFGGGPAGAALPTANPAPTATSPGAEPPRPTLSPAQQAEAAWAAMLSLPGFQRPNRGKPPSNGGVRQWWLGPEGDEAEHKRRAEALRTAGGYGGWCMVDNDFQRRDFRLRFLAAYQQVSR